MRIERSTTMVEDIVECGNMETKFIERLKCFGSTRKMFLLFVSEEDVWPWSFIASADKFHVSTQCLSAIVRCY